MEELEEGGYAFNTLWQEITQGIGYLTTGIMGGLTDIIVGREYYRTEQEKIETQGSIERRKVLLSKTRNNLPLILCIVACVAVFGIYVWKRK